MRDYLRQMERPVILASGTPGNLSYQGTLLDVFEDALLLCNVTAHAEEAGKMRSVPVQDTLLVDRAKVAFIQILRGLPGQAPPR